MHGTNHKGAVAETAVAAAATKLRIPVLRPITEHGRYDLAFEIGPRIVRVQCKWGALDEDRSIIRVRLQSNWCTPTGYARRSYTEDEIDAVAVYCADLDRCYLLPSRLVAGRREIWLRLQPPLNGQRACVNLATEFDLAGAVAQWNERPAGSRKVVGSNPTSSTPPSRGATVRAVGAHEFRNHFGYHMQRAAAGEEIVVTRRGKPLVRLVAA